MARIAIATCDEFPALHPNDQLGAQELAKMGFEIVPVQWDHAHDWKSFDAVLVRNTWGYWKKYADFLRWFDALEQSGTQVLNPLPVLRGNVDKRYLRELAKRDVPTVPTEWIDQGQEIAPVLAKRGWTEVVTKPVVSSGSNSTYHLKSDADFKRPLEEAWAMGGPAMVQPFLPEIRSEGEYSFIFLGGEYSHTILKTAAAGDFRIQWMYGGKSRSVAVTPAEIAEAKRILDVGRNGHDLLYARVDMCRYQGKLHLSELELTEPNLFFEDHPGSAKQYAESVRKLLRA